MWRGRRKLKSSRSGSTLTTGLALAELAREEARELELRWPPYSEGCHEATPGCADRNKGTGSAKRQREQKATKITLQSAYGLATHTAERKERLGLGSKPGLEKEPTSAACSGKLLPRIRTAFSTGYGCREMPSIIQLGFAPHLICSPELPVRYVVAMFDILLSCLPPGSEVSEDWG